MRRDWRYVVLALAALIAALLWPVTAALPADVVVTARVASAAASVLLVAVLARWPVALRTAMAAAVACGLIGVTLLLAQVSAHSRCLADYEGRPMIIGTTYTPDGQSYVQNSEDLSAADLLFDSAGHPERVWTADSIRTCSLLLASTGLAGLPFLLAGAAVLVGRRTYAVAARPTPKVASITPATAPLYDAFLSYRHPEPDRTIAFELLETLERAGLRVAIDARDFSPNEHFLSEMERCIKQSRFVVCVITPQYVQSDHTTEEAIISKTLDLAERRRRLVPLIYERVELPVWLHGLVGIDFTPTASVDPHERLVQLLKSDRGVRL